MDVEETVTFLLENAARSSARMDRIEARLEQVTTGLELNEKLAFQLITRTNGRPRKNKG